MLHYATVVPPQSCSAHVGPSRSIKARHSPPLPYPIQHRRSRLRQPITQEIINQIIDNLKEDREALFACSCVSRAFAKRAQEHIFAKIILFPSLERKLKATLKRSPRLAGYVHDLVISLEPHDIGHPRTKEPLVKILPRLTRIKHLSMKTYGGVRAEWESGFSTRLRTAFVDLFRSNTIEEFILQDITNFDTLLPSKSPSLRLLVLGGEASLAPYHEQPHLSYKPPSLSALMVGGGKNSFKSIMDCCSSEKVTQPAFILDALDCLSVRELSGTWSSSFHELARTSLSMLKHLVIEVDSNLGSLFQDKEYIDLSHLSSLSTLELRNISSDYNQKPFSWRCGRILRTLPLHSEVNQITFYCPGQQFARQSTPSQPSHWQDVDMSLAIIDPPHLILVHFKFGQKVFPQNPALLPMASSRGTVMRLSKMIRTWSVSLLLCSAAFIYTRTTFHRQIL